MRVTRISEVSGEGVATMAAITACHDVVRLSAVRRKRGVLIACLQWEWPAAITSSRPVNSVLMMRPLLAHHLAE